MDWKFLDTLKSIAAAEKAHNFQTESYDVAAFELKFPKNVITVAPAVGKAPTPLPGETRVTKLSDAIYTAFRRARNGGANGRIGCSIVLHEGIYVDALETARKFPKGFSMEIVGVKNVRLIYETLIQFHIKSLTLILSNVFIFDCRLNRHYSTISLTEGACVQFMHVNVHSPRADAMWVVSSKLTLVRTAITECNVAICSDKSDLRLTDCVIDNLSSTCVSLGIFDSKLEAKKVLCSSRFEGSVAFARSKGTIEDSQFRATRDRLASCVEITRGSHLFVRTSTFTDFPMPFYCSDSDSRFIMDNCTVSSFAAVPGRSSFAFTVRLNAHVIVKNCRLLCDFVAAVNANPKGKIQFRNNRMIGAAAPRILKDSMSPIPDHDFANLVTHVNNFIPDQPTDRERSAKSKLAQAEVSASEARGDSFSSICCDLKCCNQCQRLEDPAEGKFKYCKLCRKVCYCSKDCQDADWGDHKIECRSLRQAR